MSEQRSVPAAARVEVDIDGMASHPPDSIGGWNWFGVLASIGTLCGVVLWATTTSIDGAVVTDAQIVVESHRKVVQHLEEKRKHTLESQLNAVKNKSQPTTPHHDLRLHIKQHQSIPIAIARPATASHFPRGFLP